MTKTFTAAYPKKYQELQKDLKGTILHNLDAMFVESFRTTMTEDGDFVKFIIECQDGAGNLYTQRFILPNCLVGQLMQEPKS